MKHIGIFLLALLSVFIMRANIKDTLDYPLPDSVKAVSFLATLNVSENRQMVAGIKTSMASLFLQGGNKDRSVVFKVPSNSNIIVKGLDVKIVGKNRLVWNYNWQNNHSYKLYISIAPDSADNFVLYSGYIYFPDNNKWKLIGTCKINGQWNTLQSLQSFKSAGKNKLASVKFNDVWCQRSNSSWKSLQDEQLTAPVLLPFSNIDSMRQSIIDLAAINNAGDKAKKETENYKEGVYYTILKEGAGPVVSVNDTVTAFYKGSLYGSGIVFDETKDKPRSFPLNRLIKGWQLGLSNCKTGGKIKLVILSGQGYSIRTRASKIPPNSILVFEIEVVEAKTPR